MLKLLMSIYEENWNYLKFSLPAAERVARQFNGAVYVLDGRYEGFPPYDNCENDCDESPLEVRDFVREYLAYPSEYITLGRSYPEWQKRTLLLKLLEPGDVGVIIDADEVIHDFLDHQSINRFVHNKLCGWVKIDGFWRPRVFSVGENMHYNKAHTFINSEKGRIHGRDPHALKTVPDAFMEGVEPYSYDYDYIDILCNSITIRHLPRDTNELQRKKRYFVNLAELEGKNK